MDCQSGVGGVIDIHPHFGAFFAGNRVFLNIEAGFFAAFDGSKALLFILIKIFSGDAQKHKFMVAVLTEQPELGQKSREIFGCTDRVAVYDHGASDNSVRKYTFNFFAEIEQLIILQRQIRGRILTIFQDDLSGLLHILFGPQKTLDPGLQRIKKCDTDTSPGEPEHEIFKPDVRETRSIVIGCSEENAESFLHTVPEDQLFGNSGKLKFENMVTDGGI